MAVSECAHLDLFAAIGKPGLAEQWTPEAEDYMRQLSGMRLPRLLQEPQRLHEEHSALVEATQDLAFNNYKTFVQTANCSRDIYKKFEAVSSRLQSINRKLPECSSKCENFGDKCEDITKRWKLTSQTLAKHKKLVEILEIPQLMENCVKNGNLDEALELSSYVKRLERRHSHIPLIASIASDVKHLQQYMQNQLLNQLKSNIQLPTCLKIIGYLRRMELYSHEDLKMKFLETRGAWFDSLLQQVDAADSYTRLTKVMELCRVHLFDIITQYKAIFPQTDDDEKELCVFQGWIVLKINAFIQTLQLCLESDEECRLDALMSQCMYFGLSFSRVGTDFRPLLTGVFSRALQSRINKNRLQGFPASLQMLKSLDLSQVRLTESLPVESGHAAPQTLLDVPPLAIYCNSLLNIFNELRVCPMVSIMMATVAQINEDLLQIANTILSLRRDQLTDHEQKAFQRVTEIFATDLVPFVSRTLEFLLPAQTVARSIGCPLPQVHKLTKCRIDVEEVTKPLAEFIYQESDETLLDAGGDREGSIEVEMSIALEETADSQVAEPVLTDDS